MSPPRRPQDPPLRAGAGSAASELAGPSQDFGYACGALPPTAGDLLDRDPSTAGMRRLVLVDSAGALHGFGRDRPLRWPDPGPAPTAPAGLDYPDGSAVAPAG